MAWDTVGVTMLRVMINDLAATPTYSDARLEEILIVAAQLVYNEIDFDVVYTINITASTITPDPLDESDNVFFNMMVMKAACIVDMSEARTQANNALKVTDNKTSIDTSPSAKAKMDVWKEGWCKIYEKEKLNFQLNRVSTAGSAILTPFRTSDTSPGSYENINFR